MIRDFHGKNHPAPISSRECGNEKTWEKLDLNNKRVRLVLIKKRNISFQDRVTHPSSQAGCE
jgi:hypothetical protein